MREFSFKKSYEEIKINGQLYKFDFSDDKLKEYQKYFNEYYQAAKKFEDVDTSNLSKEEENKYFDDSLNLVKSLVEKLLGEGTFDKTYEDSGRSLLNMVDMITFLSDVIGDKMKSVRDEKYQKYVKNKKTGNRK